MKALKAKLEKCKTAIGAVRLTDGRVVPLELRPIPGERGGRKIHVDGILWGATYMESHGAHGASWNFHQVYHHHTASDKIPASYMIHVPRGTIQTGPARLWGDKTAKRHAEQNGVKTPIPPFEDRMFEYVRMLIAMGKLRDPEDVRRDRLAQAAKRDEAMRKIDEAAEAKLREKANEVIGSARSEMHPPWDDIRERIIAAMKWAQTI